MVEEGKRMLAIPDGYVSVKEAARRLKTEPGTVRKYIRAGVLEALVIPTASRGRASHLYAVEVRSIKSFVPKRYRPSKQYPPSLSKPDEKETLIEMLELFSRLQKLNPADVASQVQSREGARHIHRDYWPALAWLSCFFEELNATKKDRQLTLEKGEEI